MSLSTYRCPFMLRGKLVKGAVSILRASFDFWAQAASVIVYAGKSDT